MPGQFHNQVIGRQVDRPGFEDLYEFQNFQAGARGQGDFDNNIFANDIVIFMRNVVDFDCINQFVQLLGDLLTFSSVSITTKIIL